MKNNAPDKNLDPKYVSQKNNNNKLRKHNFIICEILNLKT